MIFLFPSDYFNSRKIDEIYVEQAESLKNAGFKTAAISLESLGSNSPKISPPLPQNSEIVYRGWMLSPSEYQHLVNAVESTEAFPFTSQDEYLLTHYLPNWYPAIADLTPATKIYSIDGDLESELIALGWERFFIKDYVKSLKNLSGSIIEHPSEIRAIVAQMPKFRGTIEGGICVRQLEDFVV